MGTWKITDPSSNATYKITGDSPPTEKEIMQIFEAQREPPEILQTPKEPYTPEWAGNYPNLYGMVGAGKAILGAGTEMAGMVAGGILGAPAGPLGVAAGAAGGYGLVKSAQKLAEGERLTGEGLAGDIATGVALEGVPPMLIRGAEKIAAPYAKKFTSNVINKLNTETDTYLKAVYETVYTPLPAEVHGGTSKTMAMAEGLLGYIPGSSSLINKARLGNLEKLVKYRDELIGKEANNDIIERVGFRIKRDAEDIMKRVLGKRKDISKEKIESMTNQLLTDINANSSRSYRDNALAQTTKEFFDLSGSAPRPSEMGKTVQDVMAQVKTDRYSKAGELLESAKSDLGKYELDTPITRDAADKLLQEELMGSFPNPKVIKALRAYSSKDLPPEIQEVLNKWMANPTTAGKKWNQDVVEALTSEYGAPQKTWSGLDLDRSKLTTMARESNALQGTNYSSSKGSMTPEGRIFSILRDSLGEDMTNFAGGVNPKALENFQQGKKLWRETEDLFDKDTLQIMKQSPEDLVKVLSPGEVTKIRTLKDILGEKEFEPFERALIEKIVAFDKNGILDLAKTKANINKYGETFSTVVSQKNQNLIGDLLNEGTKIEKSFSRTKALTDSIVYDSNGIIKTDATKKKLLTNSGLLKEHYTPEELAKINQTISGVEKINLNLLARNKQEAVEFLGSIIGSDNTGVVNAIVKPNNTININFLKRILGPERTSEVQQEFIKNYLMKINKFGYYSPETASTLFNRYQTTMKKLLNPKDYHEISNLMELNKRASLLSKMAENPSQTGQTLVGYEIGKKILGSTSALLMASMGIGYMGFPMAASGMAAAAAGVASPYILAKIYLSKAGRQWLTLGYQIPAGTKEAMNVLGKLSGIAGVDLTQQK